MQWRANGFTEKAVASTVMLVGCSRVVNIRLHASTFKGLRRRLHSACHSAHRTARRGARPESTGKAAKGPRFVISSPVHTVREGDKRRLRSGSNLWESRLCFAGRRAPAGAIAKGGGKATDAGHCGPQQIKT